MRVWGGLKFRKERGRRVGMRKFGKEKGGVVVVVRGGSERIEEGEGYMGEYLEKGGMVEGEKGRGRVEVFEKEGKVGGEVKEWRMEEVYMEERFGGGV